ncbi:MAG: arsenite methyltransferase [Bdellovibrionales bacterium]|nr:arsenite methyltransferase [Bdellovibrionales bacterium]
MSSDCIDAVRTTYGAVATSGLSSGDEGVHAIATAFGYTAEELRSIPGQANMGLSCGNPTAFAHLREGEVVVDLGCGGGLDVFLAANKVGPSGKAIGIDMTDEMIALARQNANRGVGGEPIRNVEFHRATIDAIPLPDASVDCVVSNCVINLAPDKSAVFREIARILRPGGRLAISDIALKRTLPEELAENVMAYVGCIAGAIPMDEYRTGLEAAGFAAVEVVDSGADLNSYAKMENQAACCAPVKESRAKDSGANESGGLQVVTSGCCGEPEQAPQSLHDGLLDLLKRYDVNDYAASVKIFAVKPVGDQ